MALIRKRNKVRNIILSVLIFIIVYLKTDAAIHGKISSKPRASIASPNDVLSLMPQADPVSKYDVDE